MKTLLRDLGTAVGKVTIYDLGRYIELTIASPATTETESNSYQPPASVFVTNKANVGALRDLCTEALNELETIEETMKQQSKV
jgi:hypothetical protein